MNATQPIAAAYLSNLQTEINHLRDGGGEGTPAPSTIDQVLDAESQILLNLPEERLRRRAWLLRERFRLAVPASRWAAYEGSSAPDAATAPLELLRADLIELQREIHRSQLLTSEVERVRNDVSRWLAWRGLAALALLGLLLWLAVHDNPLLHEDGWIVTLVIWIILGLVLVGSVVAFLRHRNALIVALAFFSCLASPLAAQELGTSLPAVQEAAEENPAESNTQPSLSDGQRPIEGEIAPPDRASDATENRQRELPPPESAARVNTVTTIMMVMVAGLLGALFSTLHRVQSARFGEDPLFELITLQGARTGVLLSAIAGVVAALFLFTLFVGGLLQGALFPVFGPDIYPTDPMTFEDFVAKVGPMKPLDHGKLLAWSFIAGFAERFTPDLIQRLTTQAHEHPLPK